MKDAEAEAGEAAVAAELAQAQEAGAVEAARAVAESPAKLKAVTMEKTEWVEKAEAGSDVLEAEARAERKVAPPLLEGVVLKLLLRLTPALIHQHQIRSQELMRMVQLVLHQQPRRCRLHHQQVLARQAGARINSCFECVFDWRRAASAILMAA